MLRVLMCVTGQHDLRFVVLAGFLCLFASVTATSMIAHARSSAGRARTMCLVAAAVVAGSGIWATHFVAMLAYRAGLPVSYDLSLTILSIVAAIALCGAGFTLALGRTGPLIGGIVTGIAISTMHYIGMAAVRIAADPVWDMGYVTASILIGIVFSALTLYAVSQERRWLRFASPILFVLAICGMHFTAMAAVTYKYDPALSVPPGIVDTGSLAIMVASIAFLIVAMGLMGVLADSRLRALESGRLRAHIAELEATKRELENRSYELREALTAASAADRAKSQFLAAMSHELRTPLNAILGFSEMMTNEVFGPHASPRYAEYVKNIFDSGAHLLALIDDVLDLSRLDASQLALADEDVDLSKIAAEALHMVEGQARAGRIGLSDEMASGFPHVRGDTRRVRQVLINLLSNAVKFTPAGGRVRVHASYANGAVAVSVSDTGIGIAAKDIPKALEYFGQVDSTLARRYNGTGMGLPLSKRLMELHGGQLDLQSAPNMGTTVTVTFPASRIIARSMVA